MFGGRVCARRLVTCSKGQPAVGSRRLPTQDNTQLTEQLTPHLQAIIRAVLLNIMRGSQPLLYDGLLKMGLQRWLLETCSIVATSVRANLSISSHALVNTAQTSCYAGRHSLSQLRALAFLPLTSIIITAVKN